MEHIIFWIIYAIGFVISFIWWCKIFLAGWKVLRLSDVFFIFIFALGSLLSVLVLIIISITEKIPDIIVFRSKKNKEN